ncbi:DUF2797 domain-containing protein [Motiliproteus coralliicola]|nr:DUF2797 domain-containing protein [Motiliproteus coralliicola]
MMELFPTELSLQGSGHLAKMRTALGADSQSPCHYWLPLDQQEFALNPLIGRPIRLVYHGEIHCQHCGRATRKSFNQGYCYPCFKKLPQCDSCIVSPEKCHFDAGTCRDADWGQRNCMTEHVVYLANSSGLKVGITRASQVPTRWIDQGAIQALPIYRVDSRYRSGLVEILYKNHVADRTNWRAMLKGQVENLDLVAERERLFSVCAEGIAELQQQYGEAAVIPLTEAEPIELCYPVSQYPSKVSSLNFDKQAVVEGVLQGIKGQYLILDTGVINIRKFGAYQVDFYA